MTDKGLLELKNLTKLTAINIKESRISDQGLDLLFAAQQEQVRQNKKKAPATDPNEIEAATSTLLSFFDAMQEWEESCAHNNPLDKEDGSLDMEAYDKFCSTPQVASMYRATGGGTSPHPEISKLVPMPTVARNLAMVFLISFSFIYPAHHLWGLPCPGFHHTMAV